MIRVYSLKAGRSKAILWSYDDSNNRQSQLEVTPTKAVLWEYSVDWLDRLVAVKRAEAVDVASLPASPLGAVHLQREYVWDESDNRTFFDDHVAGVTYHYTYKSIDDNGTTRWSDQLEEILVSTTVGERDVTTPGNFVPFETFLHDPDGNLSKRIVASTGEEISYEFSDFDRLKRVESDTNGRLQDARYDVDGLRERKLDRQGNSSLEYGVGISTSASTPGSKFSNAPTISYISGHMIMGAEIDDGTGPKFVFHLSDALGSVRDVIDDQGNVIRSFEFSEYGDLISSSGSGTVSPKTWIGGLSVNDDTADSGLWNMGHRNFGAGVLGRFISRDPIGHAGGLNLYSYGGNNPVTFTDHTGLRPPLPPIVILGEIKAKLDSISSDDLVKGFDKFCKFNAGRNTKSAEENLKAAKKMALAYANLQRPDLLPYANALKDVDFEIVDSEYYKENYIYAETSRGCGTIYVRKDVFENPDFDMAFAVYTLLHEGVHVNRGFLFNTLHPIYKETEAYNIINDNVLHDLGDFTEGKMRMFP